ncbi:MAG: TonB-dependent receptor [Steroidobacteraceae bacterium]
MKRSNQVRARDSRFSNDCNTHSNVAAHVRGVLRSGGVGSVSAIAMATMFVAPVLADPAPDGADLQEVVVTGIKYQLQSSQQRKQNADEIVDSVNAEDIGALPDRSVTEVLQRIPGISIGRIPDPHDADRIQTEGSGVTIRGLSWVRSELNGRSAFSAKNSRVLGFEDIPPELMAGVDVFKNPSAQQIEGGISGTVNLRTRLPFDSPGRKLGFSVEAQRGDLAKITKPTASLLYSDWLSTGSGDVGFLASLTNSQLVSRTDTLSVDRYYPRTDLVPGQTVYAPGGVGYRTLALDRERTGISSALQWRSPGRTVDATLQYFYTHATWNEDEDALPNLPGAALNGTNLTFSNGLLTGGTLNDGGWNGDARYTKREANNDDLSVHVNWRPADRWHLETDIQHSKANAKGYDLTVGTNFGPNYENTGPYGLQLNGSHEPTITLTDAARTALTDPRLVYTSFGMDYHNQNNADAWAYRADADYTFDDSAWLDKVRFGVRYEDYKSTTREADYNWGAVSFPWGGGTQVATASAFQNSLPYFIQSFPNWFHGGSAPTSYPFVQSAALHSFDGFVNVYNQLCAAGVKPCSWTPFNGDYGTRIPTPGALGVNPQGQKTYAGYGQLSFKHEKFDGNVGVRLVHTNTSATAFLKFAPFNGSIAGAPPDLVAFSNGASLQQTGGTSYTDALPSFNLRYRATDKVFLRFAVDKAITRPDFSQLTPSIEVGWKTGSLVGGVCTPSVPQGQPGDCVYRYTGSAGNANLKPIHAWNFDLSTEWYLNDTNSLVAALFDKQISGFVETTNAVVPYTNNGTTQDVFVMRPENQGKGYVRGFEVAWNGFFDFLPSALKNLGARTSFTYVTSGGTRNSSANPYDPNQVTGAQVQNYPLQGLSKRTYNAELYYSVQAFEARLAYNWRSRYLLTTNAANINLPVFTDDYGQLDASVQWRFVKNLSLGFEVVNLTDSKLKELIDNQNGAGLTFHNWVDSDRRYGIFLRGSF